MRIKLLQSIVVVSFLFSALVTWAESFQEESKRQEVTFADLNLNVERKQSAQLVQLGNPYASTRQRANDLNFDFSTPSGAYISANVGGVAYGDAINIDSQYSFGGAVGQSLSDQVGVEFGLQYSSHIIDEQYWRRTSQRYTEMAQYNFIGMVRYSPFTLATRFRPYVGAVVSYTRRLYSELRRNTRYTHHGNTGSTYSPETATNSVDLGLALGLDFTLTTRMSLGLEMKYMKNFVNRDNAKYLYQKIARNTSPVEDINYSNIGVSLRAHF